MMMPIHGSVDDAHTTLLGVEEGSVRGQQDSSFICKEFKMMLPIYGSVDDAHTILGVQKYYFPTDFMECIRNERLYCSRIDGIPKFLGDPTFGWVFWSQLDNFADLIRRALQKLIEAFKKELNCCLVQFWAATKTSEGRTLLTTQFQPFALGETYFTGERNQLCEYRMGMCREYNNSFYADADCAQELLGLPGRVFLHQLPESTPDVSYYTLKEYPQRDLALLCQIGSSVAVPVFEHSSHTCVGVLEIVSQYKTVQVWHDKSFLGQMYDIFQEVGLQCLTGAIHSGTNVVSEDQNYISPSLEVGQNGEVTMQLDSSHQPPLDPPNNGQHVVIAERNISTVTSLEERKRKTQRVDKGTGVRIELSLEDILKCAKMSRADAAKKLQVSVSTLKRVCRGYGINRWPPRNIKKFRSFRPSPVENEGQTQQRLNSNLPSNQGLDCVAHTKPAFHDLPSNQASDSVAHTKPAFQDADIVTIRAKYENNTIKFRLSLPSRLVALQQEVAKRLNLEDGTYYIRYEDEEKELILIACDQDLQDCIDTFKSLGKTSVVVQLEPK